MVTVKAEPSQSTLMEAVDSESLEKFLDLVQRQVLPVNKPFCCAASIPGG